ncbi:TonB-dependent receptor [Sphingomonas sp. H39-1-10]|uniref:TonB-dependent receptor n=1 Tax=Sphingomonas pollutisoli TaxID=3030829 RepID=UPI0023B94B03|nr:TonB-dependent receptor [Sphingomonas pollutisoli]MDF0489597.1 TonB-dependent receptor [Sphingomonas pollutisoli]
MTSHITRLALCASVLALAAGTAAAQTTPPPADPGPGTTPSAPAPASVEAGSQTATAQPGDTQTEDIIVTGFRASLASAINAKREAIGAIDVIKAEDIAKFPDNNLAESIQRVPGVSIGRDAGEGRSITVRGLGAQFTRIRINGMEALSTTTSTDSSGGANRGRGFDFNVFASELFSAITVRKTQSAEIDEGSLGATVDLQTAHPLDYKKTTVAASVQGNYNDLRKAVDPRLAGLFTTKFFDDTVGVLVSAAYSRSRKYEDGAGSVGFDTTNTNGGYCAPVGYAPANPPLSAANGTTATACSTGVPRPANTPENVAAYNTVNAGGGTAVHAPRLPRYGRLTHDQKRLGLTGSIQWQPSSHTLLTFDALYSNYHATREENFIEAFSFSRALSNNGKPQTAVRQAEVNGAGDLVYGVFDNVDIRSETRYTDFTTKFQQYTLNGRQDLASWWTVTGGIGYSKSDLEVPIDTTLTIDRPNSQNYSWDYRQDSRHPILDYGFDVTNPANFGFINNTSEIRLSTSSSINTFKNANIQSNMKLLDGLNLKIGGSYKRFEFKSSATGRAVNSLLVPALPAGTTVADLTRVLTGFGEGFKVPAPTPTSWVTPDLDKFVKVFDIFSNTGTFAQNGVENTSARGNIRGVTEDDKAGYGQVEFDGERLFGFPLRGDIGVRYVQTSQASNGYQLVGTAPVLVTAKRTYDNWLPSLNLAYSPINTLIFRLGASQVIARPDLGNLTPGGSITVTGARSVTVGNPNLDPIKAKTLDLAAEWYPTRDSLLSVAYFYKKISTYIQTLQEDLPFNQLGLDPVLLANSTTAPTDIFTSRRPFNTPGGPLKGFEINGQTALPLNFLPEWLNHFGVLANYTHVTSKINYVLTSANGVPILTTTAALVGLSKNAANATAYFDDGKFSIRGSLAYRGGFLVSVPGGNTGNDVNGQSKITTIDANLSYQVNDYLKITMQGLNLTDAAVDQYQGSDRNSPFINTHTGRQIYFGVGVKF